MSKFDTQKYYELTMQLTEEMCKIPAPSGFEDARAEYIKNYLHKIGYTNAYIDSAKNVIWDIKGETEDYVLFMAHTDTVFPDLTPLPYSDDGEIIRCPGVCDDTVCVAVILAYCQYLKDINFKATRSILFAANACEEGLGDLKGVKQIYKDFANRIPLMFTLDGSRGYICNKSVGSHRYKVIAKTQGGHSWGGFGRRNAIQVLSNIVENIYKIEIPKKEGARVSYNVGTFAGGTSVNTIAQSAEMLCEYRSDDNDCLKIMEEKFTEIFENAKKQFEDAEIEVVLVGNRPAMGNVNKEYLDKVSKTVMDIQAKNSGLEISAHAGSTDCNIPHSLGLPAVCVGIYKGAGVHTREEYLVKDSLKVGVNIMNDLFMEFSK